MEEVCNNYGLQLIEDCAQSHGAKYKDKHTGTFGMGAFSFYPTKNLGALGDGGAIVTNNKELAGRLRALRNYGSEKKYYNKYIGLNSRLDELQAVFLRIKLRKLDKINNHKRKLANIYFDKLDETKFIIPVKQESCVDVHHIFNIRHQNRDKLREYLLQKGVKSEVHYPLPPHRQLGYAKFFKGLSFPISELIHETTLSLPISYFHKEKEIDLIIDISNNFEC